MQMTFSVTYVEYNGHKHKNITMLLMRLFTKDLSDIFMKMINIYLMARMVAIHYLQHFA